MIQNEQKPAGRVREQLASLVRSAFSVFGRWHAPQIEDIAKAPDVRSLKRMGYVEIAGMPEMYIRGLGTLADVRIEFSAQDEYGVFELRPKDNSGWAIRVQLNGHPNVDLRTITEAVLAIQAKDGEFRIIKAGSESWLARPILKALFDMDGAGLRQVEKMTLLGIPSKQDEQ